MNGVGFCPHERIVRGLDAHYCPDCHKRFLSGTADYEALLANCDKSKGDYLDKKKDALIKRLREENSTLNEQVANLRGQLNRAKDPNPVQRPSLIRVLLLARMALMDIKRVGGGWVLSMGDSLRRSFKRLRDIFDLLTQDDWCLSDIFKPTLEDKPLGPTKRPRLPERYPPLAPSMMASTTALWRHESQCLEYQRSSP